ncbi:MAG TPA: Hint domain-containing protein [Candidatus Limnocylindria bacterium]
MRGLAVALFVAFAAACSSSAGAPSPSPTATPGATASPTPSGTLSPAELKYRIVDRFGLYAFCDPDQYPVARGDEAALAHQRLAEIQKDGPTFAAITAHLGVVATPPYSADDELAIYRAWKMLEAFRLDAAGAAYHFNGVFVSFGSPSTPSTFRVEGTIDRSGAITVASSAPSQRPPCPICLARGTLIATPGGEAAVEELAVGDLVWTLDASGNLVLAPLVRVGQTPVTGHHVVRLVLSDGRSVDVSPGHPTIDGRRIGDLRPGDTYAASMVASAELVAYDADATFDLLPAGPTGVYFAGGVPLGSTLR